MFSIILDTNASLIQATMSGAAATNNPEFSCHYADNDGTTFTEGSEGGALNGTNTVTMVSSPASGTRRIIKSIILYNGDTAAVTVNIEWYNGVNARTIANVTLAVGDTWTLEGTFNSSGSLKNTSVTAPGGSNTQVQFNDGGVLAGDAGLTYAKTTDALTVAGKVVTPYVDAVGSAGGALRNASGTAQAQWGAGGGSNFSIDVAANLNPANANVSLAPTGTGVVTINPATAGTMNNVAIGATTPLAGTFTDITLNAQGDVRFADSDSSNWVAFQAPAVVASNVTWTLPAADGSSNQVLQTNGSGTLSWATVSGGGTPGGSNTQVQFNNSGAFGGITNATTDGTTLSMTSPKVITGINDTNGNELLKVTATASAVNELTLANAATGGNPVLSATGGDTNIGITLTPKGTGGVTTANCLAVGGATPSTSGAGITFPATQSASTNANTLDDYEEGVWTPSLGGTTTYTQQDGIYTKVGNLVTVSFQLKINTIGTGSGFLITGLPFTQTSTGSLSCSGSCGYFESLNTSVVSINVRTDSGQAYIVMASLTAAGTQVSNNTIFKNSTYVAGTVTYQVA